MLIFLVFFRSLKGLLYVMTPVVFAIITTMGIAILIIGSLSEVTGAFAGLIVGLGIDLGIVLYVRYLINLDIYANPIRAHGQKHRGHIPQHHHRSIDNRAHISPHGFVVLQGHT